MVSISDCLAMERLLHQDTCVIDFIDLANLPAKAFFINSIDYGFHYLHSRPPPHKQETKLVLQFIKI